MSADLKPLENPAWWALTGVQRNFAVGEGSSRKYKNGILPFFAYDHDSYDSPLTLGALIEVGATFYLIGKLPALPTTWSVVRELPCAQMLLTSARSFDHDGQVQLLTSSAKHEIFDLIQRVQPGYYELETQQLGNYYGIREAGKLVAVAGERMRLGDFTEISAICTDPAYTGKGYAQKLINCLCKENLERGITPFLHTLTTNERAIRLYEYMGFTTIRTISFWQLTTSGA